MTNLFYDERIHVRPRLPQLLQDVASLNLNYEWATSVLPAIRSQFPKTCDHSLIHFKTAASTLSQPLKVGVVFSGGQAPGGHNVVIGIFDALKKMNPRSQLFGFLDGPLGIIENNYHELHAATLANFLNTGGFDLLGSGRTKIESAEQLEAAKKSCLKHSLDGLVIIGGDDSNTNAAFLAEYFLTHECPTSVIGVPKTIDGDLKNDFIECSFGFDTACKIYSEMIGNICRDSLSAKKYTHFIKLMGRSASHVTLECALQTQPTLTLIGEEVAAKNMTLKQIVESICGALSQRAQRGINYGVILIPEGLIEFVPEMRLLIRELNTLFGQGKEPSISNLSTTAAETFSYLPKEIGRQLLLDRDPHGNVQVSHIATDQLLIERVRETLKQWPGYQGKLSPVGHFFGYEGRCGYPSLFDANYCYGLGFVAAALVNLKQTGYMAALHNLVRAPEEWIPMGIPLTSMMDLEERKGKLKAVIKKALVDLNKEPFRVFSEQRNKWLLNDSYRFPGPRQFSGSEALCHETTFTLKCECVDYKRVKG